MQNWQQWETASEADWGLAVEREAVIRPLAEQHRLCEEEVEDAGTTDRQGVAVDRLHLHRIGDTDSGND